MSKIILKSASEINLMRQGGLILKKVFKDILREIKPGVTTLSIDKKVEKLLIKSAASPSFKKVKNYSWSTCICINEQIVHTPPSEKKFADGDLITIDIGAYYKGYHTDSATTFFLSEKPNDKIENFLSAGKNALKSAIEEVRVGNRIGHISKKIYEMINQKGYFVIKELAGHGVGRTLHEEPMIPGFLDKKIDQTLLIQNGMVLAIEVIYSMGTDQIAYEEGSKWSLVTPDSSLAACFEYTVAVINDKPTILA